jgi:hypothetical protein
MVYKVYAEDGVDFSQYIYSDGSIVPSGEQIGVEVETSNGFELILLEGIFHAN